MTVQPNEITEVLNRPISQELLARDVTRLAYVAKDGTPRTVPIAFTWNGSQLVMCTTKNAPKVTALRHNPAVALTIDTEVHPPKILLIRGRAELDVVDGIPDEYLRMNGTYEMTPEIGSREPEVRSLDATQPAARFRSRSEQHSSARRPTARRRRALPPAAARGRRRSPTSIRRFAHCGCGGSQSPPFRRTCSSRGSQAALPREHRGPR